MFPSIFAPGFWSRVFGGSRRRGRRLALLVLAFLSGPFILFGILDLVFPFPWQNLQRPPAVVVSDRHGQPLRFFLPADERWRFPVRLSELPPELPKALVASEDRRFYRHFGFNVVDFGLKNP